MNTYYISINNESTITKGMDAKNIDNLRKTLIKEYKNNPKVHTISVSVFRNNTGTTLIGRLILKGKPEWVSFAENSGYGSKGVSGKTGKLRRS